MPLAITLDAVVPVDRSVNLFKVYGKIVPSGSYATGGDTLDFSGFDSIKSNKPPLWIRIFSSAVFTSTVGGWLYQGHPGTTLKNSVMQPLGQDPTSATGSVIPLEELAAGAYPAAITGDTIQFEAAFQFSD